MSDLFTKRGAWAGGFYELDLELLDQSESMMDEALTKLWTYPYLEGCFLRSDVEPANQEKVLSFTNYHQGHRYGIATHFNNKKSCCGSFGAYYHDDGLWMTFYIPLGSLANVYPVRAYPIKIKNEPSPEYWLKELNSFMAEIARFIYQEIRFRIGIIGFEIDQFDVVRNLIKGIPSERWDGLLIQRDDQVEWIPSTIYEAPYILNKRLR